jgi:TRAP-type C4-dicarboxylate transport system permease small subunit
MLGREPRLPHGVMRVLIIALMLLNGAQLVILQAAINSSAREQLDTTWTYVAISAGGVILALALIAYGFARSRPPGQ